MHVPDDTVDMVLDRFRRPAPGSRPIGVSHRLNELSDELGELPIARHEAQTDAWAAGRTLAELDLRAHTGTLIIAIKRGDLNLPSPPPETQILPGDLLYLMGAAADIARARQRISTGQLA
jgi:K+/H+ antiporter YhaU regulatory subunit KhtT